MSIVLGVFMLICLFGMRFKGFHKEYLDRKTTVQINGIFVFLVLLSHFCGYYGNDFPIRYSDTYLEIRRVLAQLVVTTFLFFSGYGVMESIKRKGNEYVLSIPLKVVDLINSFVIAIAMYVLLNLSIGCEMSVSQVLLSCIGWESIGNSNWYLFDILGLYLITYAAFRLCKNHRGLAVMLVLLFSFAFMWFVFTYREGTRWYNTLLCYWAGLAYSYGKTKIDQVVMHNCLTYALTGILLFVSYTYCYNQREMMTYYILHGILFCLCICWLAMVLKLSSPMLMWFGNHIFGIYILQRIPMIIGRHIGLMQSHAIWYAVFSFAATALLAILFAKLLKVLSLKQWMMKLKTKKSARIS